jgi:UDPglucose--hexose-1-phosphate uridylyltransferase
MSRLREHPHLRLNQLTGEWVLVSPHRTQRPWQGQIEAVARKSEPQYDPECYLCPRNGRAGGAGNPDYKETFIFTNDYSALYPLTADQVQEENKDDLIVARSEPGICRVMCFSPRHDLTLATMQLGDIRRVVDVWADQYSELGALDWINHVQVFENRGVMMGASNPHPHCQIWADATIPNEPVKELRTQQDYYRQRQSCLICDYLQLELKERERIVAENNEFVVLVPYWAVWPFEVMVISRPHRANVPELNSLERDALAQTLMQITAGFDNVFQTPFPYSMGFHQSPTDKQKHPEWHLHAHFYPPLLRSATVRKFMVGYELLGSPQRDITPETAAQRLRDAVAKAGQV